jgi:hypothetical protein
LAWHQKNRGPRSIEKAKKQLDRYLDRLRLNEGYLVLFDPSGKDWEEKLYMKACVSFSREGIYNAV